MNTRFLLCAASFASVLGSVQMASATPLRLASAMGDNIPSAPMLFSVLPSNSTGAGSTGAGDTGAQPPAPETHQPDSTEAPPAADSGFHIGAELYQGISNVHHFGHLTDGMWAGYGTYLPSTVYARWQNGRGMAAKFSIGTGRMFNGGTQEYYQPAEAWVQLPIGKQPAKAEASSLSLTLGKFWVPIGLQEWDLESKPGAMLNWNRGATTLALATTYNRETNAMNSYVRMGRAFGPHATIGLSLAAGRGITFNSPHNIGAGLDGTFSWHGFEANTELLQFLQNGAGRFHFGWAKLAYSKLGRWKPYVSRYSWHDQTDSQGSFRSTDFGLSYKLTKDLALEGGYAIRGDRNAEWLQMHWLWER